MNKSILAAATLCVLLSGCGELFGTVVDMPRDQAAMLIYNMPNQANAMWLVEHNPGSKLRSMLTEQGVVWIATKYGKEACRFTAHVKEEADDSSVVWTDLERIGEGDDQFLCDSLKIAGEESVAAAIEARPIDENALQAKLASAVISDIGSVEKSIFEDISRTIKDQKGDCSGASTSAGMAACNGDKSLLDPTDRIR